MPKKSLEATSITENVMNKARKARGSPIKTDLQASFLLPLIVLGESRGT
jgi:hypothetical protein